MIYQAGPGPYGVTGTADPSPVFSLEGTTSVAAGYFTPGGQPSLVALNPGSNTFGLLSGLGNGPLAKPVYFPTPVSGLVVRSVYFNDSGLAGLAVLGPDGLYVYVSNGDGGFLPPTYYNVGFEPNGLTVADLTNNGTANLVVSNPLGDVQVLYGNGDGTFQPGQNLDRQVSLAVYAPSGKTPAAFIFADQLTDQVVVRTVSGVTTVLGSASTGLISPSAVALYPLDPSKPGVLDLVVTNGGSNNVLVYPGLGNGTFGPALNGGNGFFTGTDPAGITVADLNGRPDLVIANEGSNDVSILFNVQMGNSFTFEQGPLLDVGDGPIATAVVDLPGSAVPDLAVANSAANDVWLLQGLGNGFFKDQSPTIFPVGTDPTALFMGNFGLGPGLATLNAGSNNGTLISNPGSTKPLIQSFSTGGDSPITGFAGDFNGNGFTDLVVGDNADGHLALLVGGSGGLSLSQSLSSPAAPNPTAVSFGSLSDNVLSFYVSTAGRDAALQMAFDLGGAAALGPGTAPLLGLSAAPALTILQVARLGDVTGSALDLIATFVTLTVVPVNLEGELEAGGGTALLAAFSPGGATGLGQSLGASRENDGGNGDGDPDFKNPADLNAAGQANAPADRLAPWARLAVGLDEAWQELRARLAGGERAALGQAGGEEGGTSGSSRVQTKSPASLAPQADPTRSGTKSRSGSRDGVELQRPATGQEPAGAKTSAVGRIGRGLRLSLVNRVGFPPDPEAVDAAIQDLGHFVPRIDRLIRIVPLATGDGSDRAQQPLLAIAAASMTLSMTWERAIVGARRRRGEKSTICKPGGPAPV